MFSGLRRLHERQALRLVLGQYAAVAGKAKPTVTGHGGFQ